MIEKINVKNRSNTTIYNKQKHNVNGASKHCWQTNIELEKMNVCVANIEIEFVKSLELAIEKVKPLCSDYTLAHTCFLIYLLNLNVQIKHIDKYLPQHYYN